MLNFTVGPVQMDEETRELGKEQIPYFRTPEFSQLMKENESLLCEFFDAPQNSRVVFLTGSGTASMEGGIMNFFNSSDKLLVINGGIFGHRFVELCELYELNYTEIKLNYGEPLTKDVLYKYDGQNYTGVIVQLCETSTGVLYDIKMIGDFCKKNNCFFFVDAISGFLADKISMKEMSVNAVITGSQKALALPPSMSFTVVDEEAQKRCAQNKVKSIYFNYTDYLKNGERGQTPFTPAVGTLIQLNEKLKRIKNKGGIEYANKQSAELAQYFREQIKDLPFKMFTSVADSSNCVTTLQPVNNNVSAYQIFETLKDNYNIWICPNGGELKDKVFRVGHIGSITKQDIDELIKAFKDLNNKGLL